MHDILRESPYYKQILQEGYIEGREEGIVKGLEEGLKKGLQEGLQEGVQKGKLEGQREILLAIVQMRFPKIVRITKTLVAAIDDPLKLQDLTVKISMAQTAKEAKQYLLEEEEENGD